MEDHPQITQEDIDNLGKKLDELAQALSDREHLLLHSLIELAHDAVKAKQEVVVPSPVPARPALAPLLGEALREGVGRNVARPAGEPDDGAAPVSPPQAEDAEQDTEIVAVFEGIDLDQATRQRIEQAMRKALLEELAQLDLSGDVRISPLAEPPKSRALRFWPWPGPAGFVAMAVNKEI